MVRKATAFQRLAELSYSFASLQAYLHPDMDAKWENTFFDLTTARKLIALVQHHGFIHVECFLRN